MFASRPLLQLASLSCALAVQVGCGYRVFGDPTELGEVVIGTTASTKILATGRQTPESISAERVTNCTVTIGALDDVSVGTRDFEWTVELTPIEEGVFCADLYVGAEPYDFETTPFNHYVDICGMGVLPNEPLLDLQFEGVATDVAGIMDLGSFEAAGTQIYETNLTLVNLGTVPVEVSAVTLTDQVSVTVDTTEDYPAPPILTIPAGASEEVGLAFDPELGPFSFTVDVASNAEPSQVAYFQGLGAGGELTVEDLDLGIQTTADTISFDLILTNDGTTPLQVLELTPEASQGVDTFTPSTALPVTIDPGASTPFSFDAQLGSTASPLLGSIRIDSTDPGGPATVSVSGTVQDPPTAEQCTDGIDNDRNGATDCEDPVCIDTGECDCTRENSVVFGTDRWAEVLSTGVSANPGRQDEFWFYLCGGDDVQVDAAGDWGSGGLEITDGLGTVVGSGTLTGGTGSVAATGLPEGPYWLTFDSDTCESIFVDGFESGHHTSWDAFSAAPDVSYNMDLSPIAPLYVDSNAPTTAQRDCSLVFDLGFGGTADDVDPRLLGPDGLPAGGDLSVGGGPGNRRGLGGSLHYLYDGEVTTQMTFALSDASGAASCAPVSVGYQFACTQDEVCAISCDFPGCETDPNCAQPEDCSNGSDDDGDGDADCLDSDCVEECFCADATGALPHGSEEMFFGDAAGFGGTYCFRDVCGNWLNGGEPILDEAAIASGSSFFGLSAPVGMYPTPLPVGIPVDIVGFLASDYYDESAPNCADAEAFGIPTALRVEMPLAAPVDARNLVFVDQGRAAHTLTADCKAPEDGSASFRVINLSPGVDNLSVSFESVDPPVAESFVVQDVPHGEASAYVSLSAAELSDAGWASGIWRYYSGVEVVPYQEVHTTFGATDGSTAQAVHANTCMSIIATEDPADSFDTGVLLVEDPPQCELWRNRRTVPLARNDWVSGQDCVFWATHASHRSCSARRRYNAGPPRSRPVVSLPQIGRYQLGRILGKGGDGSVHEATMLGPGGFQKPVALKVLHSGAEAIRREARIGGLLRHRNLVDVFEINEVDGQWFCALELCEGSLADLIPLPPRAVVEVGLQVCAALDYAHRELGLVHLDIKPANLLYSQGVVKVADLGIARADGFSSDARVRGTLAYMAPEQRFGLEVDARADVFALGRTLLELCTGYGEGASETLDFSGEITGDVTLVLEDPVETGKSTVGPQFAPAWLAPILERCTDLNKDHRWKDMAALGAALADLRLDGPGLAEVLGLTSSVAVVSTRSDSNLVKPEDRFVGREDELAQVAALLEVPGVVTLKGPAGIGKSRLATHAVSRWQAQHGGQAWRCDLADVRSAEALLNAVSRVLDVNLGSGSLDAQIGTLGHALASRGPLVLVLDTFEHLLDQADMIRRWAARADEARFVVTSRAPLKVAGERVVELGPLSSLWSAALLTERARQRGADIRDDPDLELLAERLDGVPLALELAAGRLGVLTVSELLERFSLSLLRRGTAGRHRTIEAALDTSWEMLSQVESRALAQLSVFVGGFSLEAAEQTLDIDGSILTVVHSLADSSMVRAHPSGRFGLLSSVQQYARARLENPVMIELRHARWFASKGERQSILDLDRHGGTQRRRLLAQALGNLVVACERACAHADQELAERTLFGAWEVLGLAGPFRLGVELLDRVLALDGAKSAELHLYAARIYTSVGDTDAASEHHARAMALAPKGSAIEPWVALARGLYQRTTGRSDIAGTTVADAVASFQAHGDRQGEAMALGALALIHTEQGRFEEARACYPQALAGHREVGNRRAEGTVLGNFGSWLIARGDLEGALTQLKLCLAIARETGNRKSEGVWLGNMGILERRLGRPQSAESYYRQAFEVNREMGSRRFEGVNLGNLGSLFLSAGRLDEARSYSERALAVHIEVGNQRSAAMVYGNLGVIELEAGRTPAARAHLKEALERTQKLRDHRRVPLWIALLARCDAADGAFSGGMRRLEAAREAGEGVLEPGLVLTFETTHAELAFGLGDRRGALEALRKAEEAGAANDADAIRELARIRTLLGL